MGPTEPRLDTNPVPEWLLSVLRTGPAVLYLLEPLPEGPGMRPRWISPNLGELIGFTSEEHYRRDWWFEQLHPEDRAPTLARIQELLFERGHVVMEYRLRHEDGQYRWIRDEARIMHDAEGRPEQVVGSWTDVTAMKRTEREIRDSERRYRLLFERNLAGVFRSTADGRFLECNDAFARIFGFESRDHVMAVPAWELYTSRRSRDEFLERLRTQGAHTDVEYAVRHRDGRTLWVLENASIRRATAEDDVEEGTEILEGTLIDITERKEAELALARQGERLRALARRLVDAQEEERRRIARELHDEIGQQLTGLKLVLEGLRTRATGSRVPLVAEATEIVERLMENVRDLSLDLRPSVLDDLGLVPALLWLFQRLGAQTGIEVDFRHAGMERRADREVELSAYRIVQEALTNVLRHAGTARAKVRLDRTDGWLRVEVEDAGAGFQASRVREKTGCSGLDGIEERAMSLGGRLEIEAVPGRGTLLRATLPCSSSATPRSA